MTKFPYGNFLSGFRRGSNGGLGLFGSALISSNFNASFYESLEEAGRIPLTAPNRNKSSFWPRSLGVISNYLFRQLPSSIVLPGYQQLPESFTLN